MKHAPLAICLISAFLFGHRSAPAAETVRFETNAGFFDVELNPTDNPDLDILVANFLQYVESGRWEGAVINRAVEGFVVQMAGFRTDDLATSSLPATGLPQVATFDPVVVDENGDGQIDFDTTGLNNTRGEVALALSSNPNTGSSSFYVNLVDNSFLDVQGFLPFARISDMTLMDRLANGPIVDLGSEVGLPGNLAYSDVPVANDDEFVVFESVYVIPEPTTATLSVLVTGLVSLGLRRRS